MEGKNHRIGKADGVDMIRKRDNFLKKKKNFRNTSRKKILSDIARKGGGEGGPWPNYVVLCLPCIGP